MAGRPDGRDDSIAIHQDALVYASVLSGGRSVRHELAPARGGWLQVASGEIVVNGTRMTRGDGASFDEGDERVIEIESAADTKSELLLFDVA